MQQKRKISLLPTDVYREPMDPSLRGRSYDALHPFTPEETSIKTILWTIVPGLSKVPKHEGYWRGSIPILDENTYKFWIKETGIQDRECLLKYLNTVRNDAWQLVQEFSIARWWFLRDIMSKTTYYDEILTQARNGVTILDVGCGFGQDLRRLRAAGATGNLYGIDIIEEMWKLGFKLFKDEQEWGAQFRTIDIITSTMWRWKRADGKWKIPNKQPLKEFNGQIDLFLVNDLVSFWGEEPMQDAFFNIKLASKAGTKIIGWVLGQDCDENDTYKIWGDRKMRGCVYTCESFELMFRKTPSYLSDPPDRTSQSWTSRRSHQAWDIQTSMVELETLGFDEEDLKWFSDGYLHTTQLPYCDLGELKGLCFCLTRIE